MVRDPQTVDEFLTLMGHAIFEMDELMVCAELADLSSACRNIAHALRALQDT